MEYRPVLRDSNNNGITINMKTNLPNFVGLSKGEESDDEEFLDANNDFFIASCTMEDAFLDAKRALEFFCENKFDEAIAVSEKYKDESPVHGMMLTFLDTFFALFSLSKEDLEKASNTLEQAALSIQKFRKQNNFSTNVSNFFFKTNFDDYSEPEIYCEFVSALYELIDFLLILFGQQSIITIIKAAIKIRSCHSHMKMLENLAAQKKNWKNQRIRQEFESGLSIGVGVLNLAFSHMPSRVMSILSVMGFSCDRKKGIDLLNRSYNDSKSLPYVFAGYTIMFYNLYVEQIFGLGEGNIGYAKSISVALNSRYPNSICGIFFAARIKQVNGKLKKAIQLFERVTDMKNIKCNNIANICYWDMIWCYALMGDFENAAKVAKHLTEHCSWSRATNQYQCAVFTYAHAVRTNDKDLLNKVPELMAQVEPFRVRYAGKTIPPEKFAITRADEYLKRNYLPVPEFELFYSWNVFCNMNGRSKYINPMLKYLDGEIGKCRNLLSDPTAELDDYGLLLIIKASLLRNKGDYEQAICCLNQIFKLFCDPGGEHRI